MLALCNAQSLRALRRVRAGVVPQLVERRGREGKHYPLSKGGHSRALPGLDKTLVSNLCESQLCEDNTAAFPLGWNKGRRQKLHTYDELQGLRHSETNSERVTRDFSPVEERVTDEKAGYMPAVVGAPACCGAYFEAHFA